MTPHLKIHWLLAFQAAIDRIERDGVVVVFHDDHPLRAMGVSRSLDSLTLEELKELKLFNTNEGISTFEEVLNCVNGRVPIFVEIKGSGRNELLAEKLCEPLSGYKGGIAIQSFDPHALVPIKKIAPSFLRGQLSKR